MDSSHSRPKRSAADFHQQAGSPVRRVLTINERGLVFESDQAFEMTSSLKLGFHVPGGLGGSEVDEFLTLEGMVVGCLLCAGEDGSPVHEVTLLLDQQGNDERALRRVQHMATPAREAGAPPANQPAMIDVTGLN